MIYIENNALNKIFVDVSSATGNTPDFLWNLKNSQGVNVKNFIPRDITSTYPSQYAGKYKVFEFSTIPTLPENLTPVGTSVVNIHLPNLNQFWLGIYEQSGIVNLNPNNAVKVLNSLAFSFWDKTSQYYTGNTSNTADNVIYYESGGIFPTPTPSQTSSPTPTPTNTPTPQPSSSPTPTQTGTPTPTPTPTPSSSPAPLNPEWNLGGGFDGNVWTIYNGFGFAPNTYYFTGQFNAYDGHLSPGIVKTDANGNVDTNFVGKRTIGSGNVFDLYFDNLTDTIVLGGSFTNYGNFPDADRLVRIDKNNGDVVGFTGITFNNSVYGFLPTQLGQIIVWGEFTSYTGGTYQRIIRLNNDFSADNTYWNSATNFNSTINKVIENTNGNYVVVGNFTSYQGVGQNRIVEIDYTTGTKTGLFGSGCGAQIRDIVKDSVGNFYIITAISAGSFNGSTFTTPLFKVDASGNLVPLATWGSGMGTFTSTPHNLYLDEINGWLYISGIQGTDIPRRLDLSTGSLDTTWTAQQQITNGFLGNVAAKNFFVDWNDNNKVLIANNFTIIQGTPYNRFIRLNADGTSNTTTT